MEVECNPISGCDIIDARNYGNCQNNHLNSCTDQLCEQGVGCIITPNEGYSVSSFLIYENEVDNQGKFYTIKEHFGNSQNVIARGESSDIWAGIAYVHSQDTVYVINSQGDLYSPNSDDEAIGFRVSTGTSPLDLAYNVADDSLWVLIANDNSKLVVKEVMNDASTLSYDLGIEATNTVSFAWDTYGYFIYVQTESNMYKYDVLNAETTLLCSGQASYGMFLNFEGIAFIAGSHVTDNQVPITKKQGSDCSSDTNPFITGTAFTSYKFDGAELCRVAPDSPLPDVPPPQPDSPPPAGTPPGPPPAEGTTTTGGNTPVQSAARSSGARALGVNDNTIVESPYSTLILGGVGASVVACFAFFAVILGFNNTKKEAEVPLDALLVGEESATSANDNPLFDHVAGAHMNLANNA